MSTGFEPEECRICQTEVHDTMCDRCSRLICYGCFDGDYNLCVECAQLEDEDGED